MIGPAVDNRVAAKLQSLIDIATAEFAWSVKPKDAHSHILIVNVSAEIWCGTHVFSPGQIFFNDSK